ncbi:MAG: GDSL-type esterase/lipase family protein [Stellaceae bacterium]
MAFFGDSFVNGQGDPDALGWVGRVGAAAIARGHDVTIYNSGIRGDTSADLRVRWHDKTMRRLPAGQARGLVFSFGVNDCLDTADRRALEPVAPLANAQQILVGAKTLAPTLMIGPPPIAEAAANARGKVLSADFDALCRTLAIPFLDIFAPLQSAPTWMDAPADGAHPGGGGYRALAELVERWPPWRAWLP